MKNFSKFIGNMAKIVTKIVEVFQWVGAGMMLAATICALVNPDWIGYFIGFDACESCGAKLSVYGFEIQAAVTNGQVDMTALFLFGIGATLILGLIQEKRAGIPELRGRRRQVPEEKFLRNGKLIH